MSKLFHVYILANQRNGTTYIGMTSNLAARMKAHREGRGSAYTARHGVSMLMHVEEYPSALEAIAREKAMKKWKRAWKLRLIEEHNPQWRDLFDDYNK
jgi:putative endonuclease